MTNEEIVFVPLNKLEIDPLNVRKTYSQKSIEEPIRCGNPTTPQHDDTDYRFPEAAE
ncbi:hypothetical protein [uncultured Roseibium sp.]|uniref:hypothetical protein n=1 Tax=uncultured Roseibium sp. TaxID=1936171 RepID=UPI002618E5B9|nr:hypothetical protein [uncultured Roseibium sp.]